MRFLAIKRFSLLAFLTLILFSGCGEKTADQPSMDDTTMSSQSADNEISLQPESQSESDAPAEPSMQLGPENDEIGDALGFKLGSWPGVRPHSYSIVNDNVLEVRFDFDKTNIAYLQVSDTRQNIEIQSSDQTEEHRNTEINGIPVSIGYAMGGPMLAIWEKNGYAFVLYMNEGESEETLGGFESWVTYYVRDLVMDPAEAVK